MTRQRTVWFAIGLLLLTSLACNAFAGATEPALTLPPPPVSVTETAAAPTNATGLAPTATLAGDATVAPATSVADSGEPIVTAIVDVNVRTGPGVQYERDGFLFAGESVRVLGQDPNSGWWKIECPGRATGPECWVSGGAEYTSASNAAGVPIAAAPPTPTPTVAPSATPEGGPDAGGSVAANGLLAYPSDDGLWVTQLDMRQSPPLAEEPQQITSRANVNRPLIAPDGRKIAYLSGNYNANALHVVNVDGAEPRTLVSSADLQVTITEDTDDLIAVIGQVQWLPNSQGLAFSTIATGQVGPGLGSQDDLWTVSVDGELIERFPAGSGGGFFDISRNGQVLFGQREAVIRANLDGGNAETVITFDLVNTASEYFYVPQPRWRENGRAGYVAVSGPEPWEPNAEATLYRIPLSGPAEELGTIPGNILFGAVNWTDDGEQLGYVFTRVEVDNPPVLNLADGNGRNPEAYTGGRQLTFYRWSPDNSRFLYAGDGFYAVGRSQTTPVRFEIPVGTADMQWLTPEDFVVATGNTELFNLYSANVAGETELLAVANTPVLQFDTWMP